MMKSSEEEKTVLGIPYGGGSGSSGGIQCTNNNNYNYNSGRDRNSNNNYNYNYNYNYDYDYDYDPNSNNNYYYNYHHNNNNNCSNYSNNYRYNNNYHYNRNNNYNYNYSNYYYRNPNYEGGMIPPYAIFDDPKGIRIHETIFRDTPAAFNCVFCGESGLTTVKSKPSLAAAVACMSTMGVGFCFLLPSMDYLWHKYHYCPNCEQKVGEFEKTDPFIVADPPNWVQRSFALTIPTPR